MIAVVPPILPLLLGAVLIAMTSGKVRAAIALLAPLVSLWAIWQMPDGVVWSATFMGLHIEPLEGSAVRRLFATIFVLMTFGGALFGLRQARALELAAGFAYAAGAVGVAFAGDLITFFVFWEIMALFSALVVWCGGTDASRAAGLRYILMHLLGGIVLMVGIGALVTQSGSADLVVLRADSFATCMILVGVLVNAAAPPFSAWLPDAYPEGSATGSVFLSAYTTKTAVLALILLFPGEKLLIAVGLYMIFYGIIYALMENDIRRILAYSIVNQVGFMVCAVGIGTATALNGATAHAFAHIIYKGLLFMSAGAVIYRTGFHKCTDLGGLYRTMPLTAICGIIGALAISSFPLTSGFTTKSLISEAAKHEGLVWVYFMLAAASAGVFLHAGIKFPWYVFFQKDSGLRPKDAPWNMGAAMVLFAAACIFLGVYPQPLYNLLPYPVDYTAYTTPNVLFYLQLLLFSGLAFFLLLPMMKRTLTITLDTDWLWRVAGTKLAGVASGISGSVASAATAGVSVLRKVISARVLPLLKPGGAFAQSPSIGVTALWMLMLLAIYVAMEFWRR